VGFLDFEQSGTNTSPTMKDRKSRALGCVEVAAGDLKKFEKKLQNLLHLEK
jgi:hypothetical protein